MTMYMLPCGVSPRLIKLEGMKALLTTWFLVAEERKLTDWSKFWSGDVWRRGSILSDHYIYFTYFPMIF